MLGGEWKKRVVVFTGAYFGWIAKLFKNTLPRLLKKSIKS